MGIFINGSTLSRAQKLARRYKVNPKNLLSITETYETIVIEYVEHYKNGETAFCQKRIQRASNG